MSETTLKEMYQRRFKRRAFEDHEQVGMTYEDKKEAVKSALSTFADVEEEKKEELAKAILAAIGEEEMGEAPATEEKEKEELSSALQTILKRLDTLENAPAANPVNTAPMRAPSQTLNPADNHIMEAYNLINRSK